MVKVTFNSALAQKEAKKDEPKSSEEALIIPPDAVAVDCKVRGRGVGLRGAARGSAGARGAPSSRLSKGRSPCLSGRSFFVRKCVCRERCVCGERCLTRVGVSGGPERKD